jgi:hypothetical protein
MPPNFVDAMCVLPPPPCPSCFQRQWHFNLKNTYALLIFAKSLNIYSLNAYITTHMQLACGGITMNPATIIPESLQSNSPSVVKYQQPTYLSLSER